MRTSSRKRRSSSLPPSLLSTWLVVFPTVVIIRWSSCDWGDGGEWSDMLGVLWWWCWLDEWSKASGVIFWSLILTWWSELCTTFESCCLITDCMEEGRFVFTVRSTRLVRHMRCVQEYSSPIGKSSVPSTAEARSRKITMNCLYSTKSFPTPDR